MIDLDELERLADAATAGPWTVEGIPYNGYDEPIVSGGPHGHYVCQTAYDMQSETERHDVSADAAYIAAADPSTVKALIARIRELETLDVERLRGAVWEANKNEAWCEAVDTTDRMAAAIAREYAVLGQ